MNDLAGVSVVVTRAAAQAGPLVAAIAAQEGSVVELPLLHITMLPAGIADLAAAADDLGTGDWIAVLSPNGARALSESVSVATVDAKLASVGPSTARALHAAGRPADLVPDEPTAVGLARAFPAPPVGGRVVIAQAVDGRPTLAHALREHGWDVRTIAVYENRLPTLHDDAISAARRADAVVFASPSAVTRYREVVGRSPTLAICIGPVTGAASKRSGFTTVVATEPSGTGLVDALIGAIGQSSTS